MPSFARIVATITMTKANTMVKGSSTNPMTTKARIMPIIKYMVTLIWKFIDSLPLPVYERRMLSFN